MKWIQFALLALFYVGGMVGSFDFFKGFRPCGSDMFCNIAAVTNVVLWPFSTGSELAAWSYDRERGRLGNPNR